MKPSSSSFSSSTTNATPATIMTQTTSTESSSNSTLPTWLRRGIQLLFFPHYPPSTTDVTSFTSSSSSSSLLPTSTTTPPSKLFPCPKLPPRITSSWSRFLPFISKHSFSWTVFSSSHSTFPWSLCFRILFFFCWFLGTFLLAYFNLHGCTAYHPQLKTWVPATYISGTSSYWRSKSKCGLMGRKCAPFQGEWDIYKCAALSYNVKQLQEYFVGLNRVFEQPLVIGGYNQTYRGDSFVCAAAVDAKIVSNSFGGCVMVHTLGAQPYFNTTSNTPSLSSSSSSSSSSLSSSSVSVPFSSYFPSSYQVLPCEQSQACVDFTFFALIFQFFAFLGAKFVFSTSSTLSKKSSSGLSLYLLYMVLGFWHIILISDTQRFDPTYLEEAFTFFLPFLAIVYLIYHFITSTIFWISSLFTLELMVFILIPFFAGLHLNYWNALLPTFTFTSIGLKEQLPLFLSLVVVVVLIALYFGYYQRALHRLHWYLLGYIGFWGSYIGLSLLLDLSIHLHHYFIALLLLPFTSHLQSRTSWMVHFCLLGLFIHGSARWGLDGIFDTPSQALRGRDDPTSFQIVWNQTSFEQFSSFILRSPEINRMNAKERPSNTDMKSLLSSSPPLSWTLPKLALPYTQVTFFRVLCNDVLVNDTQNFNFNPLEHMVQWNVNHVFVRVSINDTEVYSKPIQVFLNGTIIDTLIPSEDKVK